MIKYWLIIKIIGKTKDLTPGKIAGVKTPINTESYSNRGNFQTLETSESTFRQIKEKKIGEELYPQRPNMCGGKPTFTQRSEDCLKKICPENSFATTKQIKLNLKKQSYPGIWKNCSVQPSKKLTWKPTDLPGSQN